MKAFISYVWKEGREHFSRIDEALHLTVNRLKDKKPIPDRNIFSDQAMLFVHWHDELDARLRYAKIAMVILSEMHAVRLAVDGIQCALDNFSAAPGRNEVGLHAISKYDHFDRHADIARKEKLIERFCRENHKIHHDINSDLLSFVMSRALLVRPIFDNFYGLVDGNEDALITSMSNCIQIFSSNRDTAYNDLGLISEGRLNLSQFRDRFIERLLSSFGISIAKTEDKSALSYLISIGGDHRIYCATDLGDFARSFATLHEFAHLQFNHVSRFEFNDAEVDSENYRSQEYACDQFAALTLKCIEDFYLLYGGDLSCADFDKNIIKMTLGFSGVERKFNSRNSNHSLDEIIRRIDPKRHAAPDAQCSMLSATTASGARIERSSRTIRARV
jgi:hypothetical protein